MRVSRAVLVVFVAGCHLVLLLAGFVAPYDATRQDRDVPYAPPTRIHFVNGAWVQWRPFVFQLVADADGYREEPGQKYPIHLFVRRDHYRMLGMIDSDLHLFGVDGPARVLLLGTDAYGRDEFSRVMVGGQISLLSGLVATLIALGAATIIGVVSGYYGGWIDEILMGSSELFLSLPWLYFLIGVRAFLPLHLSATSTFFLVISVIGLLGWARPARLVRGIVLSARTRNYVLAGRGFGASDFYILRRHVVPEIAGVLLTQAALLVPQFIAAEVTLSFFGLGVNEPLPSWGNLLSTLQQYSVLISYYWLLAPAGALVITSVIYWLLADTLHRWLKSRAYV